MIKIATVFSGIGAFEQALEKSGIAYETIFACDNGEILVEYNQQKEFSKIKKLNSISGSINSIDDIYRKSKKYNYVRESYMANYKIKDNAFFQDIRLLDGNLFKNEIDILVGGSPCQSFSMIGKRGGLEDARGTLFYEYARLIKEIKPKLFIYENVAGLLSHDKGKTWETMKDIFNSLGYKYEFKIINSKDHGIPQNRRRVFVIGTKKLNQKISFPKEEVLQKTMSHFLEKDIDKKYYFKQKGFEFITNPKYKTRAKINEDIIMCQKAQQQFNWNGSFLFYPMKEKPLNFDEIFLGEYQGEKGIARKLTPRECLRLMGFSDKFKIVVPDKEMYHQSGNSIVVNIFEKMIKEMGIK